MKEISSNKFYEEYETKGLGDVFSFGEVMNYHFVSSAWVNGIAFIEMTGDVWEAAKFKDMTSNEAAAWCNFIKAILGKRYEINIKTISLTYNL